MARPEPITLELSLVESSGEWYKPGSPKLFCWLHAVHLPGTLHDEGRVTLLSLEPDGHTWRETSLPVTVEQSREILAGLGAVGLPGRSPDVVGVEDTSDGWARVVLWVRTGAGSRCTEIDMYSSGFDGKDAEALRALFRRLFALAGFARFCPVIYGERDAGGDGR